MSLAIIFRPVCKVIGHNWKLEDYHQVIGDRYVNFWFCPRCGKTSYTIPKGW